MNRQQRRAKRSEHRRSVDSRLRAAVDKRVKDAIEAADLILYMNPSLPGVTVHMERSLMEQFGMDFAGALLLQAERNKKEVSTRGLDPETFAMIEGKANRWKGQPAPDLHYLWFRGETYVTTKELVPYDMI